MRRRGQCGGGTDRRVSRYPKGGEQKLCAITGHRAPLVWFSERTQDLSSGGPALPSSTEDDSAQRRAEAMGQAVERSFPWNEVFEVESLSATAPGRGLGSARFPRVAFVK